MALARKNRMWTSSAAVLPGTEAGDAKVTEVDANRIRVVIPEPVVRNTDRPDINANVFPDTRDTTANRKWTNADRIRV